MNSLIYDNLKKSISSLKHYGFGECLTIPYLPSLTEYSDLIDEYSRKRGKVIHDSFNERSEKNVTRLHLVQLQCNRMEIEERKIFMQGKLYQDVFLEKKVIDLVSRSKVQLTDNTLYLHIGKFFQVETFDLETKFFTAKLHVDYYKDEQQRSQYLLPLLCDVRGTVEETFYSDMLDLYLHVKRELNVEDCPSLENIKSQTKDFSLVE